MEVTLTFFAVATATLAVALTVLLNFCCRKKVTKMDQATKDTILQVETPIKECTAICKALNEAPYSNEESVCAENLRKILRAKHLEYKTLINSPQTLLACNKFLLPGNGDLATRFTVQYNLFSGTIVALGSEKHRNRLIASQDKGTLGCFAFTECGAGVLSGAAVETVATYDTKTKKFTIHSPTPTSKKYWISQGVHAEFAVILANLTIGGENRGPHMFYSRIQTRNESTGALTAVKGVTVTSLPVKSTMRGLDNAYIMFDHFEVDHEDLLDRFSVVDPESGAYSLTLPKGTKRMLDILISRLLTGRICLSEYTTSIAKSLLRSSYEYVAQRELWKGKKEKGPRMVEMPLVEGIFRDYSRSLTMVQYFLAVTRDRVARCIAEDRFTDDVIEATCICKFVGTSFGVDVVSVLRKLLGSYALLDESGLGAPSFVCNATCAAEGDNTIMELKIVSDIFRGRTSLLPPLDLLARGLLCPVRRGVLGHYFSKIATARMMGMKALNEGQLLRDIAWCRAHLLILDTWAQGRAREAAKGPSGEFASAPHKFSLSWLESYNSIMIRFPTPVQL